MAAVALVNSIVRGQYLTQVGDKKVWLPVTGEVTKGSSKVLCQSRGVAHDGSEVRMDTLEGPKYMKVQGGSRVLECELGPIALMGSKVTGEKFKDGEIFSNCSREVDDGS